MGILDWFRTEPNTINIEDRLHLDDNGQAYIRSIDFIGRWSASQNERYYVLWQDADYKQEHGQDRWVGGNREKGNGRILLVGNGQVLWQMEFQRPSGGRVSNDGYIAIVDCLFRTESDYSYGQANKGRFLVLTPSSEVLIDEFVPANIAECGITSDSRWAWFVTYSPLDTVNVYSLGLRQKVFVGSSPPFGFKSIHFTDREIQIEAKSLILFRYAFNGSFLNPSETSQANERYTILHGTVWQVLGIAHERLQQTPAETMSSEQLSNVIGLLNYCSEKLAEHVWERSKTERLLGELELIRANKKQALKHLLLALKLNPKVGVKKIVAKLEKEI